MAELKTIGFCIPCYNEEKNVVDMAEKVIELMNNQLPQYQYHIQFIDNNSSDNTQQLLRELCEKYPQVRAIFNIKNFPYTSGYYGIMQAGGDCTISIPCDFQVPLDNIPKMIREWEAGAQIVCLIKNSSEERKSMWRTRQLYYTLANKFSDTEIIRGFTGSGLYDKSFLDICRSVDDPIGSITQFINSCGYNVVRLPYAEKKRSKGKSKNSLWSLVNIGINRYVNKTSTVSVRIATITGFIIAMLSLIIGIVYLILKLIYWDMFMAGFAPLLIGVFFIGAVQIFFIGLIGEYVILANKRILKMPLVVEKARINFNEDTK